jgi:hypothetical protein
LRQVRERRNESSKNDIPAGARILVAKLKGP